MPNNDGVYFWDTEDLEWKNLGNVMGVKGDKGDTGNTPNITATGSISEDGGNPSVTVTKTGTVDNPNLEFNFKNIKGEKGDPGADSTVPGPAGQDGSPGVTPNITANASVSNTTGTPEVTVTKTGTAENPTLNFAFSGLKGETGPQGVAGRDSTVPGPAGRDGVDGTDGVTPTITARATVDNTSSTNPTVSVVKTGTDANPDFEFNFHGLRGLTGSTGSQGPAGSPGVGVPTGGSTGQFLMKNSSTNYDTKWVTRHTVPTGGSMGYVLQKNSGVDGDYSWAPMRDIRTFSFNNHNDDTRIQQHYSLKGVNRKVEKITAIINITSSTSEDENHLALVGKRMNIECFGYYPVWSQSGTTVSVDFVGTNKPGLAVLPDDYVPADCLDWWHNKLEDYVALGVSANDALSKGPLFYYIWGMIGSPDTGTISLILEF